MFEAIGRVEAWVKRNAPEIREGLEDVRESIGNATVALYRIADELEKIRREMSRRQTASTNREVIEGTAIRVSDEPAQR